MSYVLTEIALEMLGYKYYNVDGVYKRTSFQENSAAAEPDEDEPNLEVLLRLTEAGTSGTAEVMTENDREIATTSSRGPSNAMSSIPPEGAPPVRTQLSKSMAPNSLTKLFEREYEKLCEQVARNNVRFVQTNAEAIQQVEQRGGKLADEFVETYIKQEEQLLQKELQTMEKFRYNIEASLVKMNLKLFKKYAQTLKSNLETFEGVSTDELLD